MHFAIPVQFQFLTGSTKITFSGETLKSINLMHLLNKCSTEYFNEHDEFPLNSTVMKQLYGKNYTLYIEYLIQQNFFHKTRNHSTAQHISNRYTLNSSNLNIFHYLTSDYLLQKKLKQIFKKNLAEIPKAKTTIPIDIRKKLISDLKSITLDYEPAITFLNSLQGISHRKYHLNLSMINNIIGGNLFFTFDPYGRFHNNYTNLKKEIRSNYLKIDGMELESLDIKSSQPLFLAQIIKENYSFSNPEINEFINIVENHDLYNYFKFKCQSLKNDRDKAKKMVVMTLFDDKNKLTKHKRIFKTYFPEVFKFIETYQSKYHEPLWMTLQRKESLFIYNSVYRSIINVIPNIKLLTIHDSIYFPKQYKEQIEEIWFSALNYLKN